MREKKEVESLWLGRMATATPRQRQRMAYKLDIRGGGIFADNLGIVSIFSENLHSLNHFSAEVNTEIQHRSYQR